MHMPLPDGFVPVSEQPATIPEIGVGMLGHGFMGRAHTNAFKMIAYTHWPPVALPRLVAVCGRNDERAAEAARRYGYAGYYTDWRKLLANDRIQLFDNAGPDDQHVEPTIAALKAGKHVLCEKPLALSAADAARMLEAARRGGTKHMCGFNYRFVAAVRLARDLIDRGLLGQIYEFRATYLQGGMADPDQPLRRVPPAGTRGAGALSNIGSHIIDQARFLVGEIATVSATMRTFVTERATPTGERVAVASDDAFAAVIELENGAIGTLEASRVAAGRKNQLSWEINGSKGSLAFDLERLNQLQVYLADGSTPDASGFQDVMVTEANHPFAKAWWPRGHIVGWEHAHINEIYHLLEAIALDRDVGPFGATFEDGYRNAVICDAVAASVSSGARVPIRFDL
jgi:predicted dehydrogenase